MKGKLKAEKEIRIPIELTKKLDKISILDMQSVELVANKDKKRKEPLERLERYASSQALAGGKITTMSLQSRMFQESRERQTFTREKSSSVRFRTTGAGFRQRVIKKTPQPQQNFTPSQFKISISKQPRTSLQQQASQEYQSFKQFIVQKQQYQKRQQPLLQRKKVHPRHYFGEKFAFQQEGEFQYNQKFTEQDMQWEEQIGSYERIGFGVDSNLSLYDVQSLADPDGQLFMQKHKQEIGKCPFFKNGGYSWIDVKIIGFDIKTQQAIVNRLYLGDVKKVSRLSIKFDSDQQSQSQYWIRVNTAKKYFKTATQFQKYCRYIYSRNESFPFNDAFLKNCSDKWHNQIKKQWYIFYSRQFLLYKEMDLKAEKFTSMGIKIRKYQPFQQLPIATPFGDFEMAKEKIITKHYSKFQPFHQTLCKLLERLNNESCSAFLVKFNLSSIQQISAHQCNSTLSVCSKITKKIRELLISDIMGPLAFCFKTKAEQKKYYKLHNLIYQDLLTSYLYIENIEKWKKYLNSFSEWTQERLNPIIKVTLTVEPEKKIVQIIPSTEIVIKLLKKPIQVLEKQFQQIPDLLSEVLGGEPVKVKINHSLLHQTVEQIERVVKFSFDPVAHFTSQYENKLRYLQRIKWEKQPFSKQGQKNYRSSFEQIKIDLKEVTHTLIFRTGLLEVNSNPLKAGLGEAINKQKQRLGKLIQKQIDEQVERITQQFQKQNEYFKKDPQDEQELVQMRAFLNGHCYDFLDQAVNHFELCNSFFLLLQDYFISYSPASFQKNMGMVIIHYTFMQAVKSKLSKLLLMQQEMIDKINEQRQQIILGIESLSQKKQIIKGYESLSHYSENYVFTNRSFLELQAFQKQLENINYREQLLGQEMSIFPALDKLEKQLKPFYQLWNMVYELTHGVLAMKNDPIHQIKYEWLKDRLVQWSRQLQRLTSFFTSAKNASALSILESLQQKITFSQQKLWIIRSFTLEGMTKKQGIRNEVLTQIFKDKQVKFSQLTLQALLKENVQQHKELVITNAEKAERIWKLELRIADIVSGVKELQFVFEQKQGVPVVDEKMLLTLACSVHQRVELMDVIKDLEEAQYIQKKVSNVHFRLKVMEDTLRLMIDFQENFFPLRQILSNQEIAKEMQKECSIFKDIEKVWKLMCAHFMKDGQLWEAIDTDSYKNRLENSFRLMTQIDKKLDEVIDKKRSSFPRLFFISRKELKFLLIDPTKINCSNYITLLFAGVKAIIMTEDEITGIAGHNRQQIIFKKTIKRKVLWTDLKAISQQLKRIVDGQISISHNKNPTHGFGKAAHLLCSQTHQIEQTFAKKKDLKNILPEVIQQISSFNKQKSLQNYMLCSLTLHHRDNITALINKGVKQMSHFQWKSSIKFYKSQTHGVELKFLNFVFGFQSEYTGNHIRPFILLSERSLVQTVVIAWQMNTGLLIPNYGLETIKEICGMTMRHFVVMPLSEQTTQDALIVLLKGYLLSQCWTCFEVKSAVNRQICQILSQVAFQIHSVAEIGDSLFHLGGESFNLSKYFKFNLFISHNQSYTQGKEVPVTFEKSGYQLKSVKFNLLFRSFSFFVPPTELILRFYLQSMGLSAVVTQKFLKCYQIYKLQNIDKWYHRSYLQVIKHYSEELLNSSNISEVQSIDLFSKIWMRQLKIQQQQPFKQYLQLHLQQQENFLPDLITLIDTNQQSNKHIMLVGPFLSGKKFYVQKIFKQKGIAFTEPLQYDINLTDQWISFEQKFYSKDIPLEQKLVLRTKETNHIEPSAVDRFIILYHRQKLSWKQVVQQNLQTTILSREVKEQVVRQLSILFNRSEFKNHQLNSTSLSLCLSLVKILQLFTQNGKLANLNLIQRNEIIFMFLLWQVAAVFPKIQLNPADYGSAIVREPFNYYYDVDKSTWLDWVTLHEYHRNNTDASFVSELFVPVRESIALSYFLSSTAYKSNIWVQSQVTGIGLHRLLSQLLNKGILQMYRAHKSITYEGLSKVVNFDIAIFKKQGKYHPILNQNLTICIEDINLSMNTDFQNQLSVLINYSYDRYLKRLITKTCFVCTNYDSLIDRKMALNIAKSIVYIRAQNLSQDSKMSIFNYYLEWFFGNTENPFSKEVRKASDLIVKMSIHILKQLNNSKTELAGFSNLVQVFEGICLASPRTVKSTVDILHLWYFQINNIFHNDRFKVNGLSLENIIIKYIQDNQVYFDSVVVKSMNEALKVQDLFVKEKKIKMQYADTYRKVERKFLYQYLRQEIEKVDFRKFSHLPLIIYTDLLNFITRVLRIFAIPKRHVLLYGGKGSCQKIVYRLASIINWGEDAQWVACIDNWQNEVITVLHSLVSNQKQKCLIFTTIENESDLFLEIIEQIIRLHHPRTFLLDHQLKYLDKLGLSSASSQQYNNLKKNIERCLTCCITSYENSLEGLLNRYPALMRRVQSLNILESYQEGGLTEMARLSIGSFYLSYPQIQKIDHIFSANKVTIGKQKWIRILQLILHYYQNSLKKIQQEQQTIDSAINKIRTIQHQRDQLQQQLNNLNRKLEDIKLQVQILWDKFKKKQELYRELEHNCNNFSAECQIQRSKTDGLRKDMEVQYSKVEPMLTAAQEIMAKVTRDDINQLRSFPNPPLPAAKVVESLVFLFNQQHLVKEKVLQSGQKVRDFWQYAKKMILNDQLLKRVKEFNPETIKSLNKGIIATLKGIIKKPQFMEGRVFKASSAAGNLSLWVKAIIAVYDVMQVLEPKRILLNQAQQFLSQKQAHLHQLQDELNEFHQKLMQKKNNHDLKVQERESVKEKIKQIEHYLQDAAELLNILHAREKQWMQIKTTQLPKVQKEAELNSVIVSITVELLVPLPLAEREQVVKQIESKLNLKMTKQQFLYNHIFLQQYQYVFYDLFNHSKDNNSTTTIPFTGNFLEGMIAFHELIGFDQQLLCVCDNTYLFYHYLQMLALKEASTLQIQFVNCLTVNQINDFLKEDQKMYQDDDSQSENQEPQKQKLVVITQLEHSPSLLLKIKSLLKKYQAHQILLLVQRTTDEMTLTMQQMRLNFDISFNKTNELLNYFVKEAFNIPTIEALELIHNVDHQYKQKLLVNILLEEQHLITHSQILQKWITLHHTEVKTRSQMPTVKKITKIQEQTFNQIIHLLEKFQFVTVPVFLKTLNSYFSRQQPHKNEPTLWGFPQYLANQLKQHHETVMEIVSAETDPIDHYLLLKKKISELLNPVQGQQILQPDKPYQQLYKLYWHSVDPISSLSSLNLIPTTQLTPISAHTLSDHSITNQKYLSSYFNSFHAASELEQLKQQNNS